MREQRLNREEGVTSIKKREKKWADVCFLLRVLVVDRAAVFAFETQKGLFVYARLAWLQLGKFNSSHTPSTRVLGRMYTYPKCHSHTHTLLRPDFFLPPARAQCGFPFWSQMHF